jgi:hypothetical protein
VKHFATPDFWRHYHRLPSATRELADRCFDLLKTDSAHPSLHLKRVGRYWSVRVGKKHRALAVEQPDGLFWFWVGRHAEYDRLLRS